MTLIESMVAMTISSVLILGSIQMYSQARSNYRTTESVARMQENLRFSIDILDEDVRLAGYWGKTSSSSGILTGRDDVIVTCDGENVTDWVLNRGQDRVESISSLQNADDLDDLHGCPGTNTRPDSDVLIVRHASAEQDVDTRQDVVQIQSNSKNGQFFDNGIEPGIEDGDTFDVAFSAYYVSNESKYDENLPSLRRLSLEGNNIQDQEIIPGVENLQVQFGIDLTDDGQIDRYVNGDDPLLDTGAIKNARLWLLVRSEQNESGQGYEDNKGPYFPPDANIDEIDPLDEDAELYPPTYRRMALSRTIVLRN